MLMRDPRGVTMTVGDAASPERYEAALFDVLGYAGDPIGKIEAALADDPGLVMGHLLRAHTFLFALQPGFAAKAATSQAAARVLAAGATPRERLHLAAATAWAAGDYAGAGDAFDAILAADPRDLTALMFAHQADFFGGAARGAPTAAAMAHWDGSLPGYGFVQSMLAFGLEEAGDYGQGRSAGAGGGRQPIRRTSGASMPWVTCWRCRAATPRGSTGTRPARPTGRRAATSRSTMPGIWHSTTSTATTMPARSPSTTGCCARAGAASS